MSGTLEQSVKVVDEVIATVDCVTNGCLHAIRLEPGFAVLIFKS
jgi:Ni,Fe-hydrogenase I small subunit